MRRFGKTAISFLLAASVVIGGFPNVKAEAAGAICESYSGENVENQNYTRWANPIDSYLEPLSDGTLMRVQYGSAIDGLLVEYYDEDYNVKSSKIVEEELPIFGGFYATESNYFIVTGQTNEEESEDVEVFRITKYDTEWNKVTSVGLKDCNTTVPFDAGSCRMDVCENYLLIRTSHEMYQASDGYNHQSNVTMAVDMENMTITDSITGVKNSNWGYVSHSFNQFIKVEDNKIVAVDHGDAYPRSIAILKYQTDVSDGTFAPNGSSTYCSMIDVLEFPGEIGQNVTGASVGGFEISDSDYLIAGNSVLQDSDNLTRSTRNVFVAAVDKATSEVSMNQLTDYEEGDGTTSTPQMVKIASDQYVVLWSRDGNVYYTTVDAAGEKNDTVYCMEGELSDCVPVIYQGKLVWYTWNEKVMTFYDIDTNDLSVNRKTEIINGHQYENQGVTDGVASLKCSVCQQEEQIRVASIMLIYWNEDGGYNWYSGYKQVREVGDELYCWINIPSSNENDEMEILSSDDSIASVQMQSNTKGVIRFHALGDVTITVRPKYNPDYAETFKIAVAEELKAEAFEIDKESPVEYGDTLKLSAEASGGVGTCQYKFYEENSEGQVTVIRDYAESAYCEWKTDSGIRTLYVDIKDESGAVVTASISDYVVNQAENPTNMPEAQITVPYSISKVSQVELPEGWNWQTEDIEKALSVGESVTATAEYEDKENYKVSSMEICISRLACEHMESGLITDKEATCKEAGTGHTECTICFEVLQSDVEIPLSENHSWDTGVVTKQPTMEEEGIKTFTCTVCDKTKTENIAKLENSGTENSKPEPSEPEISDTEISDQETSDTETSKPENSNTETSDQETSDTETSKPETSESETSQNEDSKKDNSGNSNSYVAKNETLVKDSVKYKVVKAGESGQAEVAVVSAGKNSTTVVIPDTVTINNVKCKVTAISAKAFSGNKKIKKLVLGKNIKTIGEKAFYNCKKLKSITIKSNNLQKVGKQAIKGIQKKAVITVPKKKWKTYKKLWNKKSGFVKTMKIKKK